MTAAEGVQNFTVLSDISSYTVIVADDEDELREAVCTMIPWEALGFHLVGSASNGLDALELVERLEPDLLLTDIRMVDMDGLQLIEELKKQNPCLCSVIMTAHPQFE